jgi:hypothetical protein
MAGAAIRYNPGGGEVTIATVHGALGRFNGFQQDSGGVGESAIGVGDGRGYRWTHRTDYKVALVLPHIAITDEDKVEEFLRFANDFGIFAIDTGINGTSYSEVQIAPGTRAVASPPDPQTLDLSISMTIINIAASPGPLLSGH